MKKRGLILSLYPAPYRIELYNRISKEYDIDVFLEKFSGDSRNQEWFQDGKYFVLEDKAGSAAYKKALRRLSDYRFVVLYEYASVESIKLIKMCRRYRIPYIINCDGVMMEKHGNFIRDLIKRYLIQGASGFFASGENAKRYFLQYGANERKIHIHTFSELEEDQIAGEPVSAEKKTELRKKLDLPLDHKIAIAVGRFIPLKRFGALIESWKDMPQDFTLLLIGGGSEEKNYRKIIEKNQIQNVVIHGFMAKQKLFEYYKASDIFVHPTSYDVWGLVVNEAMACGLPAVVSDHCIAGLELIRNGENGYQVPMGDDREMCRRVIEIMSDKDLYSKMSRNALESIRPYTMSNMAKIQIHAIQEMIGG